MLGDLLAQLTDETTALETLLQLGDLALLETARAKAAAEGIDLASCVTQTVQRYTRDRHRRGMGDADGSAQSRAGSRRDLPQARLWLRAVMSPIPRLKDYRGPALLSYGFRPFFLFGAIYAALAILAWLPIFGGELTLRTAFGPIDWHVHEMLYGYLPAIVTGFLLTAIPNWTGRLPIQGMPLLMLFVVWLAGRVAVTFSAEIGWLTAAIVDVAFLVLVIAATAREIVAGKNWRNLRVIVMVTLLLAGNVAFHLEAHFNGSAEYGARIGIAASGAAPGGDRRPHYSEFHPQLAGAGKPGPAAGAVRDVSMCAVIRLYRRDLGAVDRAAVGKDDGRGARHRGRPAYRAAGAMGRRPHVARPSGADLARWLCLRAVRVPACRRGRVRPR